MRSTATALAILCALLAVAAQGGRFDWRLDVLTHFAPLYAAGALLGAAVGRRRVILLLAAVTLASTGVLAAPEFTRTTGPAAQPGQAGEIRVVQFNALRRNGEVRRVADWLAAQDADVITVTEARHDLRDILVARGWRTAGAHGNLIIFTRERYLHMTRPALGPDAELTFVNATYRHPAGPVEVVTTHLDWPTRRISAIQADELAAVVRARPTDRMILTGDFNAAPWSFRMRRLDRELGLTRRDRAVASFPARAFPVLPIDHVYAGPGWATVRVERGPDLGSDHYPLIVTLAPVAPR